MGTPRPGHLSRASRIVLNHFTSEEAELDAVADDGRQVTLSFALVIDPVLVTERIEEASRALASAGHRRSILPMLRLL